MRFLGEALTSLIMSCSVDGLPVDLIHGIVKTESSGYVYALSGSFDYSDYYLLPKDDEEIEYAHAVAYASLSRDINISIGLMQVNSVHIKKMNSPAVVVYDPCNNLLIGSGILKEIMARVCGTRLTDDCLDASLRQYNTGSTKPSEAGGRYVAKVRGNWPTETTNLITSTKPLVIRAPLRATGF